MTRPAWPRVIPRPRSGGQRMAVFHSRYVAVGTVATTPVAWRLRCMARPRLATYPCRTPVLGKRRPLPRQHRKTLPRSIIGLDDYKGRHCVDGISLLILGALPRAVIGDIFVGLVRSATIPGSLGSS